jgi:hypothetical protein
MLGYDAEQVAAWAWGTLRQGVHRQQASLDTNLVRNGDFSAGTDEWTPSGWLNWRLDDGVLRVTRLRSAEAPDWAAFYQDLDASVWANTPFEVALRLGNSSGIAKTLTVTLLNQAGRQYGAASCSFALPPNTALQDYSFGVIVPDAWASIRVEISVNPPDGSPAALVDDVAVTRREVASASCDTLDQN